MADVTIDAAAGSRQTRGMRSLVFTTPLIGYQIFIDGDADLKYTKTTDGGATWGTPVNIFGTSTTEAFDVWYDQWTPGDKGRIIHIFYFDSIATDDPTYKRLDTASDTLSSAFTIVTATSVVGGRPTFISGAKMRGGNLICCYNLDDGTETGTYKSVNNGATWSATTNIIEANNDQALVFPGNATDPQDGWFLYHDADVDELSLKVYDDSGNSFTEAAIGAMIENTSDALGQYGFTGSIRFSDGHLLVAYWSERDSATGDFKFFDTNGTASIVEKTALATDKDDSYYPSLFISPRTGVIYLAYTGKTDGLETLGTTASVYYAKSTNGGTTWTTDVVYSATASDWAQTWAPLTGPKFMVSWRDTSSNGILTNLDNALDFGPVTFNNYQFAGAGNGISVTEKIR